MKMKDYIPYRKKIETVFNMMRRGLYIDEGLQLALYSDFYDAVVAYELAKAYITEGVDTSGDFSYEKAATVFDAICKEGFYDELVYSRDSQIVMKMLDRYVDDFKRQHEKDHSFLFKIEQYLSTLMTDEPLKETVDQALGLKEELMRMVTDAKSGRDVKLPSGIGKKTVE